MRTVAYAHGKHAAARTDEHLFSQLILCTGNKRTLLDLIGQAIAQTGAPARGTFVDFFAGSGIVSRLAKKLGYRVIANDSEPHTQPINECAIGCDAALAFARLGGYEAAIDRLNQLPPRIDWVTQRLCPRDDAAYDATRDRLARPMSAEFVLLVNIRASNRTDPQAPERAILESEKAALEGHSDRRMDDADRATPAMC